MVIYRLIFKNQLTKRVYVFVRADEGTMPHFYRFRLPLGMENGEYEYFITDSEGTLVLNNNDIRKSTIDGVQITIYDRGMAMVGKIERKENTDYNLEKTYTTYKG